MTGILSLRNRAPAGIINIQFPRFAPEDAFVHMCAYAHVRTCTHVNIGKWREKSYLIRRFGESRMALRILRMPGEGLSMSVE